MAAKRVKIHLKMLNMDLTTVARGCGKSNVHYLELKYLGCHRSRTLQHRFTDVASVSERG